MRSLAPFFILYLSENLFHSLHSQQNDSNDDPDVFFEGDRDQKFFLAIDTDLLQSQFLLVIEVVESHQEALVLFAILQILSVLHHI